MEPQTGSKYTAETFLPWMSVMGSYRTGKDDPDSYAGRKFYPALEATLCFTTKAEYLDWVRVWKATLVRVIAEPWTRNERWALLEIRKEGKRRSWAMKQARLAAELERTP